MVHIKISQGEIDILSENQKFDDLQTLHGALGSLVLQIIMKRLDPLRAKKIFIK